MKKKDKKKKKKEVKKPIMIHRDNMEVELKRMKLKSGDLLLIRTAGSVMNSDLSKRVANFQRMLSAQGKDIFTLLGHNSENMDEIIKRYDEPGLMKYLDRNKIYRKDVLKAIKSCKRDLTNLSEDITLKDVKNVLNKLKIQFTRKKKVKKK